MVFKLIGFCSVWLAALAAAETVSDVPPDPLPPLLQQPSSTAPVQEPAVQPFAELDCADDCVDCGPMRVQPASWYGGTDVLFTALNFQSPLYHHEDTRAAGIRPYLGREYSNGVGMRGRLWLFGVDEEVRTLSEPEIASVIESSAVSFDVDFYRRFYFDRTSFLLGAGTKAASVEFEDGSIGENRINGGGVSVFAEGHHPFYCGPKLQCAFIGYGRISALTGRIRIRNWPHNRDEADTNMSITELGVGLELKRKFRRSDFVFQIVSEVQRWETNISSDLAFDSLGLRFGGQW